MPCQCEYPLQAEIRIKRPSNWLILSVKSIGSGLILVSFKLARWTASAMVKHQMLHHHHNGHQVLCVVELGPLMDDKFEGPFIVHRICIAVP